jgi:beta-N-acetylhexosaminidase
MLRLKRLMTFAVSLILISNFAGAQYRSTLSGEQWVDSVFKSLSKEEKLAQLMVVRAHSNLGPDHVAKVISDIEKYNIGALCFFQGGPVRQANLTNHYQKIAKTPIMVTIDGEWGLGMRLDSVTDFPYQLTLGSLSDPQLVYRMGIAVGEQCKRLGVHVNYAPVVDINNNPNNPVIGYRSFGEDKYKVAAFGAAYMKGMQDAGILACAKHFPGHGDTEVDSHLDLPLINKTKEQLDSLELLPFRELFSKGVGSVMIAHLYIPSIDNTANRATSLSKGNVTDLLRISMGYEGLTFTDALEMKGVTKYFPSGEASVQALIAGNDMLCLPDDVGKAIDAIKQAIKKKKLSWDDIDAKVKKVLAAKYRLGLNQSQYVNTNNLLNDLNAKTDDIIAAVAKNGLTVLKNETVKLPLQKGKKIAYVGIGVTEPGVFAKRIKDAFNADMYYFSFRDGEEKDLKLLESISSGNYDAVIVGIHNYNPRPANNYGISNTAIAAWRKLQPYKAITFVFGNVYAAKNFCGAENLVACYQDEAVFQQNAADLLVGKTNATGKLPVTICPQYKFGDGIVFNRPDIAPKLSYDDRLFTIDSIVYDAIAKKAFPGCVVLAAHEGQIIYHKAFGNYSFDVTQPVSLESIYDLASVTKISATTVAVMKLYEEGRINLKKKLGDYLPWVRGTDKENLELEDILLHQAGLVPFIPFYRETIDTATGIPFSTIYAEKQGPNFSVRVAENLYLRNDWQDTMFARILNSPLGRQGRYVYSDNDFIFLGKFVEELTGLTLDQYVKKTFYDKIGMHSTTFQPRNRFNAQQQIIPTELEKHFRRQMIQGDVHDEGASMFGGIAGHAGLFSNAYDLSLLYQMLLNGGEMNGQHFLSEATIKKFTAYGATDSRRGLGFDKPEKDNATRKEPYPSALVSPEAFGHTGFTGTCVWVDPKYNLVYIFLSNRVNPTRNNPLLSQLSVRGKIQDAIYKVIAN